MVIKKAFVLAAGLGARMRPLTDATPKPLLRVAGRTMLDRCLDALAAAGVEETVINTHYLAPQIEAHVQSRAAPRLTLSREEELLDTGGGVKKMLAFFGDTPFFVLNADVVWTDGPRPALTSMAAAWDNENMDLLLLLHPCAPGKGDYYLAEGSAQPVFGKRSARPANYIFAGPRLAHPRLFAGAPAGAFSFLQLFHQAEERGRLFGLRHEGEWFHVGTPAALAETDRLLTARLGQKAAS